MSDTWNVLNEIIENGKDIKPSVEFIEALGKCPKCGGNIIENLKHIAVKMMTLFYGKKVDILKKNFL